MGEKERKYIKCNNVREEKKEGARVASQKSILVHRLEGFETTFVYIINKRVVVLLAVPW